MQIWGMWQASNKLSCIKCCFGLVIVAAVLTINKPTPQKMFLKQNKTPAQLNNTFAPSKRLWFGFLGLRRFPNSNSKSNGFTCRSRQRWSDTLHLSSAWLLTLWLCGTLVQTAHYASDQLIISFQSEDAARSIHPTRTGDGKRLVPM